MWDVGVKRQKREMPKFPFPICCSKSTGIQSQKSYKMFLDIFINMTARR